MVSPSQRGIYASHSITLAVARQTKRTKKNESSQIERFIWRDLARKSSERTRETLSANGGVNGGHGL